MPLHPCGAGGAAGAKYTAGVFGMSVRKMVRAAVIAAMYVALCLVFQPISYGPVQLRLAEALTLLPVLCPEAVVGVTVGCFVANLLGGQVVDMAVGTAATLLAALLTWRLRRLRSFGLPLAAALPPVLLNALLVGAELTVLYNGIGSPLPVWLYNMLTVGAGQLASCALGVALVRGIEKVPPLRRMLADGEGL